MQKIGTPSRVMIEARGFCACAGCGGIFVASSAVEAKRTVADRAHMKVAVRTFGRDARVADWLTRFFQIITRPFVVDVDAVMVGKWLAAAPERLTQL
ncbi:hypothetical protein CO683_00260 [Bradyrhizobium ottawaense]|uniref:Uncharacterized protein n=1 Tax=Bradyrhizobium ottawaense TaxID=931866 RepID=A0A2U8PGL5_9BRAD|nr:hypothetical protein CIT37_35775 [Bradyrhizobium ottawaense]MDA9419807.1 hypothetical protein [Bradyrhizobium sp. CCBAU 25360]MDA9485735.1 hypothetical protein [Bradyrhizobium sp. CCBAU 11445]PDT71634.1 hypothetical protein CO683_00260 [Bradyrhizobium ottawaense]